MAEPSTTSTLERQAKMEAILNGPAGTPPPGILPNFDDPSNQDIWVILTLTLAVTFATLAVWIRMYTKKFIIRSLTYEDCRLPCDRREFPSLTLARCSVAWLGNAKVDLERLTELTAIGGRNWANCPVRLDDKTWRWKTHLGRTNERVSQIPICLSRYTR